VELGRHSVEVDMKDEVDSVTYLCPYVP
jgi:hypothetical protein